MHRLARPLLIASALVLSGCVILPVPIPASGTMVDVEAAKLQPGSSTRAEVHGLLGPPNHTFGERYDVWALERDPFHLAWIIAFAYGPAGVERSAEPITYSLVTVYDDADRLAS